MKEAFKELMDWIELPFALRLAKTIRDQDAIDFAVGFTKGVVGPHRNMPYKIILQAFRKKHRRYINGK